MSLFERLQRSGHPGALLDTQYRMHREISRFPSGAFYSNELRDAPSVPTAPPFEPGVFEIADPRTCSKSKSNSSTDAAGDKFLAELRPYVFLDLAAGRETRVSGSYANELEADYVSALVAHLMRCSTVGTAVDKSTTGVRSEEKAGLSVGVITPYAAQRSELARRLLGVSADIRGGSVEVNTVDGFQARHK